MLAMVYNVVKMTHSSWSTGTAATLARSGAGTPRPLSRTRAALAAAVARAVELGYAAPPGAAGACTPDTQAGQVSRWLGEALSAGCAPTRRADLVALLGSVSELRCELLVQEPRRRLKAIAEACDGLARMRGADDPDELLARVAEEACRSCGFERVVVARIDGGLWTLAQAHFRDDPAGARAYAERLGARRLSIAPARLETDMIRRRAAALVDGPMISDPDVPAALTGYVAAPIIAGDRVMSIVYAGRATGEADELDRDVLRWFADGVAELWERATLRRRLCDQRDHVRDMVSTAGAVLTELCDADIELRAAPGQAPGAPAAVTVTAERRLDSLITRRELEVLALMAEGGSNTTIAERLVIAEGTVKSHVKHILRKLAAANRAEAVARYLHQQLGDHHAVPRT